MELEALSRNGWSAAEIGPGGPAMAISRAINGPPGPIVAAIVGPPRPPLVPPVADQLWLP